MISPLSARGWNALAIGTLVALAAVGASSVPTRFASARILADRADDADHLLSRVRSDEEAHLRAQAESLQGTAPGRLAAPERASDVVRAVHSAAAAMGVDLAAIRPVPGPDGAWTLHIEFEGHYNEVGFFLALLEGDPLSAQVPTLRLDTAPRSPSTRGPRRLRGSAELDIATSPSP